MAIFFNNITQGIRNVIDIAHRPFKIRCDPKSLRYRKLESRVPVYMLPDPLVMLDGGRVRDKTKWNKLRREEILEIYRHNVYGRSPLTYRQVVGDIISIDNRALSGLGTRKEIRIKIGDVYDSCLMTLLMYLPNRVIENGAKVPCFLGLNFFGNHTIHPDPEISIAIDWVPNNSITRGNAPDTLRGIQYCNWPLEFILRNGYGVATAYCGDIIPDRIDSIDFGVQKVFRKGNNSLPKADSWGAISGWAWGLSRAMDCLAMHKEVDTSRIAVFGHSRLGKAALWAGAQDERFAMVISNESGCGGAALFRRKFGETVAQINNSFPHWFCDNFKLFNEKEETLPIDQHELISLIAPRPVYIASAQLDLHADPMGEFLAARHANSVYQMMGKEGLPTMDLPDVNTPVMGTIGYHMRKGFHGVTLFDWSQFILFADKHFRG